MLGGEKLRITVCGEDIFLGGQARIVYQGEFSPMSMGL